MKKVTNIEKLQKDLAMCFIAFGVALLTLTAMGVAVAITLAIK
jgi:hypothetical protein